MDDSKLIARMRSGTAVMGDIQHLPGYSVLVCSDASIDHLSELDWPRRQAFLFDLSLLGEAIEAACRDDGLRRINYEVLGNSSAHLHGHVHARYVWEPLERQSWPVWNYPADAVDVPYDEERHGPLRQRISSELETLMARAYGGA